LQKDEKKKKSVGLGKGPVSSWSWKFEMGKRYWHFPVSINKLENYLSDMPLSDRIFKITFTADR